MASIQTVLGPVDADELGVTLIHEHVRFRDEAVAEQWPGFYDAEGEMDAALQHVSATTEHGVKTIVEPTAMFGGRDVEFIRRVAEQTGVNLVACTGIYTYDYLPHYFANRSDDQMAEHFVADIERGVQGTDIKAGFLKCAADEPGVTPNVEKVHRAVARASLQTGAPIMAHSRPASNTGPRQMEIFAEEGVDPGKVQVAHTGDTDDLDYIERVLDTGAWIGLTATAWRCSSPWTSATPPPRSCCGADTRTGCSSARTSARRSTGSRPRPRRACSKRGSSVRTGR